MSALSLSLRDKDRFRDWEERAWQYISNLINVVSDRNPKITIPDWKLTIS